ncbi:DUF2326 domain-containing protein [Aliarcobacter butzleri]|uniref:DUF2326 domain-containing protein n=1 Tax=Aliarcobacter butzleri TaxID=28197 RepID=UPI00344FA8EF
MIKRVFANYENFKEIEFNIKGFNVILAHRHDDSTDKDSRNGLGKTTLIEIIHFCFGADLKSLATLNNDKIKSFIFGLDVVINNVYLTIQRSINHSGNILINGQNIDLLNFDDSFYTLDGNIQIPVKQFNMKMGKLLFDLNIDDSNKYSPTFRALFSYFVRKNIEAFTSPFKFSDTQREWNKQVCNTFLLGINAENAKDFQILKDKKETINQLKKAGDLNYLENISGNKGELRAKEVRLDNEVKALLKTIDEFKVHPEYESIQKEANEITREVSNLLEKKNTNFLLLTSYQESLNEENIYGNQNIEQQILRNIYEQAGLIFTELALKQFEDIEKFHKQIISNRKEYLDEEILRLQKENESLKINIDSLGEKKSELIKILHTHGALTEYTLLQNRLTEKKEFLEKVTTSLENIKAIEENELKLNIEAQSLLLEAQRDLDEREMVINEAITLFNEFSNNLYSNPGILSIDIKNSGFKFDVDIERSGSQGVGFMKTFCYDLVLARLQAKKQNGFHLLIHDSTIFDGVDERQIVKALKLAYEQSKTYQFQYICTLNTDNIPYNEMDESFKQDFANSVRKTLSDENESGSLLGLRF